jgi:hypothetical protein
LWWTHHSSGGGSNSITRERTGTPVNWRLESSLMAPKGRMRHLEGPKVRRTGGVSRSKQNFYRAALEHTRGRQAGVPGRLEPGSDPVPGTSPQARPGRPGAAAPSCSPRSSRGRDREDGGRAETAHSASDGRDGSRGGAPARVQIPGPPAPRPQDIDPPRRWPLESGPGFRVIVPGTRTHCSGRL